MANIRDVARLAGVSSMTVSRVVNGTGYTSQETRARVERAIAELGYVPNAVARQLRSKRSHTIALVVTDITNPFFTTIARGVEDEAAGRDFGVMFCNTDESDAEEIAYLQMLIQRQVDGVLLVPASNSGNSLRLLHAHRVPVVVIDRRVRSTQIDEVRTDSEAGAYALVRHLVELGHRNIAMLSGRREISTSVDRVAGYRRALAEVGVEVDSRLVLYRGYDADAGLRMAREILDATPRPTAIFAANNFIAFGAMRALREAGIRVPDDMSVVAFDDLPDAWVMDPFMTVINQPAYDIGRRAAELLLERLTAAPAGAGRKCVLPGKLVVRGSSAPPSRLPATDGNGGAGPVRGTGARARRHEGIARC
ncbi:MAG: LacI family transcriptional regulator [Anaerolinea sp.]|nr:LacI family transcriptional regulator [Anaerolinea sp.]